MSSQTPRGMSERSTPTETSSYFMDKRIITQLPILPPLSLEISAPKKTPNLKEVQGAGKADHIDIAKPAEGNSPEEEQRKSRIAEFEWRARSLGITGEEAIAQKVAIWEGMWAAKQRGNETEVSTVYSVITSRL